MMTSCERVLSYCKLPGELSVVRGHAGGLESDKGDTSTSLSGLETAVEGHDSTDMGEWPTSGQLQFRNVNLFYNREDRPILQDLSFEIASGQKYVPTCTASPPCDCEPFFNTLLCRHRHHHQPCR